MMRFIYSLTFYILLPLIFLRLFWKGRKNPGYRKRWWERLGFVQRLPAAGAIWIHAVSLGEMVAAKPLILEVRKRFPDRPIVITNMTATGAAMARQLQINNCYQFYVPYDLPGAVQRFIKRVQPCLLVIMETELWPNLIHGVAHHHIPILLANGRLSEHSATGYQRIKSIIEPTLRCINTIAVQTQQEAQRFIALGAPTEQVAVLGNIKFDVPIPAALIDEGHRLRESWGAEARPVLIAASTHGGEEESALVAFAEVRKTYPTAFLVLVPRHPERFDEAVTLAEQQGYQVVRRSQKVACHAQTDVLIGDSFGEMFLYFALADVVFVGGSLAKIGGHNVLEPAALALPVVVGTHMFNFTEIFELLNHEQAIMQIQQADELAGAWLKLLDDQPAAQAMGRRAREVMLQNQGALEKHLVYIQKLVNHN